MKKKTKKKTETVGDSLIPKRAKDVLFRKNADGTVAIMKLDRDDYFFSVDGLCAELWLKMDGKRNLEKITSAMIKEFNPPEARFKKDVTKFITQLRKEKLIQ